MQLTGEMLIGAETVAGSAGTLRAFDPSKGEPIDAPAFGVAQSRRRPRMRTRARCVRRVPRAQPFAPVRRFDAIGMKSSRSATR